jgi:hypothetical protein
MGLPASPVLLHMCPALSLQLCAIRQLHIICHARECAVHIPVQAQARQQVQQALGGASTTCRMQICVSDMSHCSTASFHGASLHYTVLQAQSS